MKGISALSAAQIETNDSGISVSIELNSFYAGNAAVITCKSTDECFVYCGVSGACEGLSLICHGRCVVECGIYSSDFGCPPSIQGNATFVFPQPTAEPSVTTTLTQEPEIQQTAVTFQDRMVRYYFVSSIT